jgi:O-acetyl-ADP-ribose deacetylase (regulator of RNase III)
MTVIYRIGNAVSAVIDGEVDVLLHCANCQGVMGSGIAAEIAERIPAARQVDSEYASALGYSQRMLGTLSMAHVNGKGSGRVMNLYGQFKPCTTKRAVDYGAIATAMMLAKTKIDILDMIAIPYKMGCDRAGGNWEVVLELIKFIFKDHLVVIYSLDGIVTDAPA